MTKPTVPDWILDNFTRLLLKQTKLPKSPLSNQLHCSYLYKTGEEKAQFVYKVPLKTLLSQTNFNRVLKFWNIVQSFGSYTDDITDSSPQKWFYTIYAETKRTDKITLNLAIAIEDFPEITNCLDDPRYKNHRLSLFDFSKTIETLPQALAVSLQCLSACLPFTEESTLTHTLTRWL